MNMRLVGIIVAIMAIGAGAWLMLSSGKEAPPPQTGQLKSLSDLTGGAPAPVEPEPEIAPEAPAPRKAAPPRAPVRQARETSEQEEKERSDGAIRGRVQLGSDAESAPGVADAIVIMERTDSDKFPMPREGAEPVTATSDSDGKFSFDQLPIGTFGFVASKDNLVGTEDMRTLNSNMEREIVLVMSPGGSIGGQVRNAAGEPVTNALVFPHKREDEERPFTPLQGIVMRGKSDDAGKFEVGYLRDGVGSWW